MKTWYHAVCDEHREICDLFVNNVATTHHYLMDKDETINAWLQLHYGCKLRLIYLDPEFDEVYGKGYSNVTSTIPVLRNPRPAP